MAPVINATAMPLTISGADLTLALVLNVVVAPALSGYRALAGTGWTTRPTSWASWGIAFLLGTIVYTFWRSMSTPGDGGWGSALEAAPEA